MNPIELWNSANSENNFEKLYRDYHWIIRKSWCDLHYMLWAISFICYIMRWSKYSPSPHSVKMEPGWCIRKMKWPEIVELVTLVTLEVSSWWCRAAASLNPAVVTQNNNCAYNNIHTNRVYRSMVLAHHVLARPSSAKLGLARLANCIYKPDSKDLNPAITRASFHTQTSLFQTP